MNVNSQPKTLTFSEWIKQATHQLTTAGISSARLDAEILLSHTIRRPRTFLHAHPDTQLDLRHLEIADARLRLRLDRTPIAYIVGHKEFYGRLFKVTPSTLVPRPESETIIDLLKKVCNPAHQRMLPQEQTRLIDVGTGSGCLGITAKLEIPTLEVTVSDTSVHALRVAETNAKLLHASVQSLHSNLLESYPFVPDIILANLPYVDREWERSPETNHEPEIALFADNHGLQLIERLLEQAETRMKTGGYLFLEADPRQHDTLCRIAKSRGFKKQIISGFIIQLVKL